MQKPCTFEIGVKGDRHRDMTRHDQRVAQGTRKPLPTQCSGEPLKMRSMLRFMIVPPLLL